LALGTSSEEDEGSCGANQGTICLPCGYLLAMPRERKRVENGARCCLWPCWLIRVVRCRLHDCLVHLLQRMCIVVRSKSHFLPASHLHATCCRSHCTRATPAPSGVGAISSFLPQPRENPFRTWAFGHCWRCRFLTAFFSHTSFNRHLPPAFLYALRTASSFLPQSSLIPPEKPASAVDNSCYARASSPVQSSEPSPIPPQATVFPAHLLTQLSGRG
jgi:hypothetical protein